MFTIILFVIAILALIGFVFFLTVYFNARTELDHERLKHGATTKWLLTAQADVNFRKEEVERLNELLAIKELDLATAIKESNDVNYNIGKLESGNMELTKDLKLCNTTIDTCNFVLGSQSINISTINLPHINFTSEECSRMREWFNNQYRNTNLTITMTPLVTYIVIDESKRLESPLEEVGRWCWLLKIVLHIIRFRSTIV